MDDREKEAQDLENAQLDRFMKAQIDTFWTEQELALAAKIDRLRAESKTFRTSYVEED